MKYDLLTPAAEQSRQRAIEVNRGQKRNGGKGPHFGHDTTPQICECTTPWHDGEGRCVTCAKRLREPHPRELF